MSHITKVTAKLKDPEAFKAAIAALARQHGVEIAIEADTKPRYFSGTYNSPTCDLVARLPGRYDVGLQRQPDGSYQLIGDEELFGGLRYGTDNYGRNDAGRKILGEDARALLQQYHIEEVRRIAERKGGSIEVNRLQDGRVDIVYRPSQTVTVRR